MLRNIQLFKENYFSFISHANLLEKHPVHHQSSAGWKQSLMLCRR